ncbi:MAG: DUF2309 domain-containing protein [Gammaproteobacteria bacterium HGW-Gammaproteobacteria-6]|nr:MAG: DUF2309 domain-containing protein [Gammaproteobacteria bacterium HGW-Gammaproteobacteria-6]
MNMIEHPVVTHSQALMAAAEQACAQVAPTWPLDRMIAVNPLWERRSQPWHTVAEQLWQQSGSLLTFSPADYQEAWASGRISERHLQTALQQSNLDLNLTDLHLRLNYPLSVGQSLPLLEDLASAKGHLPVWRDLITHQIGQFCAAWFDTEQADWHLNAKGGLYAAWRDNLLQDHGLSVLSGCRTLQQRVADLPLQPAAVLARAVDQLSVDQWHWADWFDALLQRSLGWASWCAYQRWQARLQGEDEDSLIDLLAIRTAWQLLVDDGERDDHSVWHQWQHAFLVGLKRPPEPLWEALQVWQRADELAWQEQLQQRLGAADSTAKEAEPVLAKLYFCIDVRSEVMRRAIEQHSTGIETAGFAGFFGLPIEYAPLGTDAARPQLPGLLAAQMQVSDSSGDARIDHSLAQRRVKRLSKTGRWRLFERLPASTFTLVETLGLGYAASLLCHQFGRHARPATAGLRDVEQAQLSPVLLGLMVEQKADLAARILAAMGLTSDFPPLLVLLGHASQSANNPQAAGLACGACCGQSGEVNARLLAAVLNDQEVRQGLAAKGISIPDSCHAVAGLHNTTTDEISLFDQQQLPASLQTEWQQLRQVLDNAAHQVRAERAEALGLAALAEQPEALLKALRTRAGDWAQTRPEWGLANNAAFIAAPRWRTQGVDLQGRAFLHDYDWRQDSDGSILELIMTAPMVVAHWINMQYLTSTTDNQRFGSGNKVLHNVVGGRIGVFEGNGGDLRIGLAKQSVHDGQRWMHTPLRLTVVIDAPREMIDAVLAKHEVVRQLVEHQWLYLQCMDSDHPGQLLQRGANDWSPLPFS